MAFELFPHNLTPAESEETVCTYHCTTLSARLLGLKAEGYLVVTNKRVIFHAFGSSRSGKSILQSEVPIADVSGLSSYKGTFFSWLHFLGALLASVIVGAVVAMLVSALLALIFSRAENGAVVSQVLLWLLAIASLVGSFYVDKTKLWRGLLASSAAQLLSGANLVGVISGFGRRFGGRSSSGGWETFGMIVGFAIAIYALVCFVWYARRETMSLYVNSKGGSSTPIAISGMRSFGLTNSSASRALTAEPALQAERMIRELGAVITDIQMLGDFGVERWKGK